MIKMRNDKHEGRRKNEGGFTAFCFKNKWLIIISILMSVASGFMIRANYIDEMKALILDQEEVTGIEMDYGTSISLRVTGIKDGTVLEREVILTPRAKVDRSNQKSKLDMEMPPEDEMDIAINRVVRELNNSTAGSIELPREAGEGIALKWEPYANEGMWYLPMMFPPLLMVFLYRGQMDKVRKETIDVKEKIGLKLPEFNNKLVLLMGSGLVYDESIRRISKEENKEDELTKLLFRLTCEADRTNKDITVLLNRYAGERNMNDLKRLTAIILENRRMGTNLIPKLETEGELLWEKRKKRAEERGKLAERKLTIPLGIMLISLLFVTAGPAILQM